MAAVEHGEVTKVGMRHGMAWIWITSSCEILKSYDFYCICMILYVHMKLQFENHQLPIEDMFKFCQARAMKRETRAMTKETKVARQGL